MGIYGTWFIATEEQVAGLWRIRRGSPGINPFTKEVVVVDTVLVDGGAIARLPGVEAKFLIDSYVGALFGNNTSVEPITPPESEEAICRIPDAAVRKLVDRAPSSAMLFSEWKGNLATLKHKTSYADAFDETVAVDLYEIAKMAVESSASLYGYVR
jgi:hypothetical protein